MSRLPSIQTLMSPPESELIQDFHTPTKLQQKMAAMESPLSSFTKLHPIHASPEPDAIRQPPSPPESPAVRVQPRDGRGQKGQSHRTEEEARDPVLYPRASSEASIAQSPGSANYLFPSTTEDAIEEAIKKHIKDNAHHFVKPKSRGDTRKLRYEMPSLEEYRLALNFVSNIGHGYNQNPGAYFKRTQEENRQHYPMARKLGARPNSIVPPNKRPKVLIPRSPASRITKVDVAPKRQPASRPKAARRASNAGTPRSGRALTPATRIREPKKPIDYNFAGLPDLSPSSAVLSSNPKALKIDWDGTPLDLSNDPHGDLLHEAELSLSSALRLTCARYLVCKRRIFIARVEALKIGKDFKKTDAQQACQIDVNKASKLWMAYEKVGWLNAAHFQKYL